MPVSQHSSISARLEQRHLYTTDALLDALLALYDDCEAYQRTNRQETIGEFLSQFQKVEKQLRAARINKNDFEVIRPLANGLFGIVSVVRSKLDGNVYAMKVLSKDPLLQQQQKAFSMEERLVLSHPDANHWMPVLHAAFQDVDNLYLVMEYAGGGDLFSVLDRKENLCLNEDEARFYMAETILAVDSLHALGYVHRDIKPQNILIDNSGHVKLADFGSCIRIDHCSKIPPTTPVGTCDYVSPEVLESQQGNVTYGTEVDWWSVGIVLYEVLQENPPFYSRDSESETYRKIIFHQSSLKFNDDIPISEEAKDLICKLLCKKEDRLGKNGIQEIQHHPFFKGIDWENIRGATPPFLPVLSSPDDTSNFSVPEEDTVPTITSEQTNNTGVYEGRSLPFIGYTYSSLMPNTTKDILPSMKDDIANLRQLNDPQLRLKDMLSDTIYTEEVHNAVNPKVDQLEQDNTKLKLTVTELEDRIKSLEEISNQQACELQIWKEQELQQKSDRSQKEASLSNLLQTIQALTNDTAKLENEKNNALQELENETSQRIELKENLEKEILDHEQTKQHLKLTSTQLQSHKKDNTVHETQHQDYIQHLANVEKSLEDLHNEKETLVCAITAERKECQLLRALAKSTQLTAASLRIELENLRREFKTVGKTRQIAKTLPALPTLEPNAPEQGRSMILSIMWRKDRETIRQLEKALEESENALHDAKRDLSRLHKDALQPQHRITETVTGGLVK
ncbi:kinase-like domain-containing protein [Phycomyces blakesleeanus]|uniref:non-specific serine/threonine protein kinase n=2 Tax=Phycomyces blakesleeanus TaxID=4837 RepID=A0ABR3AU15_PHYBL